MPCDRRDLSALRTVREAACARLEWARASCLTAGGADTRACTHVHHCACGLLHPPPILGTLNTDVEMEIGQFRGVMDRLPIMYWKKNMTSPPVI